jgi:hypothetical protein
MATIRRGLARLVLVVRALVLLVIARRPRRQRQGNEDWPPIPGPLPAPPPAPSQDPVAPASDTPPSPVSETPAPEAPAALAAPGPLVEPAPARLNRRERKRLRGPRPTPEAGPPEAPRPHPPRLGPGMTAGLRPSRKARPAPAERPVRLGLPPREPKRRGAALESLEAAEARRLAWAADVEKRRAQWEADALHWHFRSVILDRLEEYFVCIKRMREHDPAAYTTFSRMGFAVTPDLYAGYSLKAWHAAEPEGRRIPPEDRVSMGGHLFALGDGAWMDATDTGVFPSFVYFRKLGQPFAVQWWHGDIYELTCLFDDRDPRQHWIGKRWTAPAVCHLGVSADGDIALLKEEVSREHTIVETHPRYQYRDPLHRGRQGRLTIATRDWQYPPWLVECCVELERRHNIVCSPVEWATTLLWGAIRTYRESLARIVIRVRRDDCVAAFGIELPRAKYFFRDRDATVLARDGRRARIFHSVVAHEREVKSGRVSVRSHYRGLRTFEWNGYAVHIVLPANTWPLDMPVKGYYEGDEPAGVREWIPEDKFIGDLVGTLNQ